MRTYTKKEIAAKLKVTTKTIENMVADHRLPDPLPLRKCPLQWDANAIDQIADAN